jgi:hypothetical protein
MKSLLADSTVLPMSHTHPKILQDANRSILLYSPWVKNKKANKEQNKAKHFSQISKTEFSKNENHTNEFIVWS